METKIITDNEFLIRLGALTFVSKSSFFRPNYYDPDRCWGFSPCKNWNHRNIIFVSEWCSLNCYCLITHLYRCWFGFSLNSGCLTVRSQAENTSLLAQDTCFDFLGSSVTCRFSSGSTRCAAQESGRSSRGCWRTWERIKSCWTCCKCPMTRSGPPSRVMFKLQEKRKHMLTCSVHQRPCGFDGELHESVNALK